MSILSRCNNCQHFRPDGHTDIGHCAYGKGPRWVHRQNYCEDWHEMNCDQQAERLLTDRVDS